MPKITPKQHFTVKLEGFIPVKLTYNVWASSNEEALSLALQQAKRPPIKPPIFNQARLERIRANIYLAGSNILKLTRFLRKI